MFEPRNIWIGLALCVAAYLAYITIQPSQSPDGERVAYLRTTRGAVTDVTKVTQAACEATANRVWAIADSEVDCLAYVTAGKAAGGRTAFIYFHGDFPKDRQTAAQMARSVLGYQRRMQRLADELKMPAFAIARPGVMGSTGFHVIGGVRKEHQLIASAVDTLKQRYGFDRLVLGGQSGGARVVAQLLTSGRRDIDCAAMASGAYGIPGRKGGGRMSTNIWGDPSKSYLIPLRSIDGVVHDDRRRLFVVGDRRDKRTAFAEQREWADALRRAGHHAVLVEAPGGGKEFHSLGSVAMRIAGMCVGGKSDGVISAYAHDLKRRAERTLPTVK